MKQRVKKLEQRFKPKEIINLEVVYDDEVPKTDHFIRVVFV